MNLALPGLSPKSHVHPPFILTQYSFPTQALETFLVRLRASLQSLMLPPGALFNCPKITLTQRAQSRVTRHLKNHHVLR